MRAKKSGDDSPHSKLRHCLAAAKAPGRSGVDQPAPFDASWELRCGPNNRFRVFYEVDSASQMVWVLAIGLKDHNRHLIGGEDYES